jgi:RNA polymerase sigma-70 factor (ECF subfamily)
MNGETDRGKVTQAYAAHCSSLVDLAFRMLGDIGAAEDVVQEAFSRLMRADVGAIEDERGGLIVVTSRLSLDQIRSAHSRRERSTTRPRSSSSRRPSEPPSPIRPTASPSTTASGWPCSSCCKS